MLRSVLVLILFSTLCHQMTTRQVRQEQLFFLAEKILIEKQMGLKNHFHPLSLAKVKQVTVTVFSRNDVWKMEDADSGVEMRYCRT